MLRQYGAIPFTFLKEEPLVLMITSRTHERWIFPKGVKQLPDGPRDLLVTYFPLHLTEQVDDWPERKRRDRHWVTLADARKIAGGQDILHVLQGFESFLPKLQNIASAR